MEYIILAVVAGFGQAAAHWFPWQKTTGKLPRVAAYTIGTCIMLFPYTVWLVFSQQWEAAIGLAVVVVTSGIVVAGAYGVDAAAEHKAHKEIIGKYQND